MKRVQVLLSTYNGEKYLKQQLDSIIAQTYENICILVRDDGSSDSTVNILREYAHEYNNITYILGRNIGTWRSFYELINKSDDSADYFAFADQDDFWKSEKIERAVESLEKEDDEQPVLYASDVMLVDERLNQINTNIRKKEITPSLENALVENICAGCTEVFNKKMRDVLKKKKPDYMVMHDWWVYLCASCFGKVIYDQRAYVLYRQHADNQMGVRNTFGGLWLGRIARATSFKNSINKQAKSFIRIYGRKNKKCEKVFLLAEYKKNIRNRVAFALSDNFQRQYKTDNLIYRFLFIIGVL